MKKSTLALICVSFVISITQTTAFASSRKENTFVIRNNANQNSNKAIFQNDVEEFTDGLFYIHTDKTKEQIIEETGSFDVFEVYTDGINEYVETNELLISGVRDVYAVFKHINMTDVILGIDSICFPKGFTIYKVKCGVSDIDFLCSKIQDSKLCNAVSINFIYQYKTPTSETSDVLNVLSNNCSCEGSLVFLSSINFPNSFKFPNFLSLKLLSKLKGKLFTFAIYFAVALALV